MTTKTHYSAFYPITTEPGTKGSVVPPATSAEIDALVNSIATVLEIGDDDKLTAIEKQTAIRLWGDITNEYADLNTRSTALSITTELTSWMNMYLALSNYLTSLVPAWNDTTQSTTINRAAWNTAWANYYDSRIVLQMKISSEDAKRAEWDSVTGAGKVTVVDAATNFNNRNDRNAAAVVAPTFQSGGTAVDHVVNTDGSVDLSLEWNWSGAEADIDGFYVYVRSSTSGSVYTIGSSVSEENKYFCAANKRAIIFNGIPANLHYTFGVQAYRKVDQDINASGEITSTLVQNNVAGENPYQPSTGVAFSGNITGTIAGTAATTVLQNISDLQTAVGVAQSAAEDAQTSADTANLVLAEIASDSILTPVEKPTVIQNRDEILNEQAGIVAQANAYSIVTERDNYIASITALTNYLATLTTPVLWSTLSGNTNIVGADFRNNFLAVYNTRQALLNKIYEFAKERALWSAVTGTGKPEDNATRGSNKVFNGDATQGTDGWTITTSDTGSFYTSATSQAIGGLSSFILSKAATGAGHITITSKSIQVIPGQKLFVRLKVYGSVPTVNGLYLRINERPQGPEPTDMTGHIGQYTGLIENQPVSSANVVAYEFPYVVPAGINWVSLSILNWIEGPNTLVIDDIYLGETQLGATAGAPNGTYVGGVLAENVITNMNAVLEIGDDDKLTPVEKQKSVVELSSLFDEYYAHNSRVAALGISTEWSEYEAALGNLEAYLGSVGHTNTATTTTIVRSTWRANWSAAFNKLAALQRKISEEDAKRAVWNQTANRPPLLTSGESVTVDEFLRDPSVWSVTSNDTSLFSIGADGEGIFSSVSGAGRDIFHKNDYMTPIDHNATYEVEMEVFEDGTEDTAGAGPMYLGIELITATGSQITGDGSFWRYFRAYQYLPSKGLWHKYSERIGRGTNYPFPPQATKFGLLALLNYASVGAGVIQRVRRMKVRRITDNSWTSGNPPVWSLGDGNIIRGEQRPLSWANTAFTRSFIKGPQRFTFRWSGGDGAKMAGFTEQQSPNSWGDGTVVLHAPDTPGALSIYADGAFVTSLPDAGDRNSAEFTIEYDGLYIRMYKNGVAYNYSRYVGPDKSYKAFVDSYYGNRGIVGATHTSNQSVAIIGNNTFDSAGTAWIASNGAGTTLNLIAIGTIPPTLVGNSVIKPVGSSSFNSAAAGTMPMKDTAFVSVDLPSNVTGTDYCMIALDDDLTNYERDSAEGFKIYLQYLRQTGDWVVYTPNATVAGGTLSTNLTGTASIVYDGVSFKCYINSTLVATVATTPGQTLYAKWPLFISGAKQTGLQSGFATDHAWSNVGGSGRPQDYATRNEEGANLIPNASTLQGLTHFGTVLEQNSQLAGQQIYDYLRVRKDPDANGANCYFSPEPYLPVTVGEKLFFSHWVFCDGVTSGGAFMAIQFFDAAGSSVGILFPAGVSANTPAGWVQYKDTAIVPAAAAKATIFWHFQPSTGGSWFVGRPYVGRTELAATVGAPNGTLVGGVLAETVISNMNAVLQIGDDDQLTPVEKQLAIRQWDDINDDYNYLVARKDALGITTEWANVYAAYVALANYLNSLSPLWNDTSQSSTIVRSTWRANWNGWFGAKAALEQKISEEDAKRATWSSVGGSGRPADFATRNEEANNLIPNALTMQGGTSISPTTYLQVLSPAGNIRDYIRVVQEVNASTGIFYINGITDAPVNPNEKLYVAADFVSVGVTGGVVHFCLEYFTAAGVYITTTYPITVPVNNGIGWTTYKASDTVVPGAAFMRALFVFNPVSAGHWLASRPYVGRQELGATIGATAGINLRKQDDTVVIDTEFLNNRLENNTLRIPNPVGGSYSNPQPNIPGHIKIRIPATAAGDTMIKFTVDIFDYGPGYSVKYEIAGYPYGFSGVPQWANCSAQAIGEAGATKSVHFGYDSDNRAAIWIGETNSLWQYPSVKISNFQGSYSNFAEAQWATGWSVTIETAARATTRNTIFKPTAGDAIVGTNTRDAFNNILGEVDLRNNQIAIDGNGAFYNLAHGSHGYEVGNERLRVKTRTVGNKGYTQIYRNAGNTFVYEEEVTSALQNADQQWSDVNGVAKPADYATADIKLIGTGTGIVIKGNAVSRPSGDGNWSAQAYTPDGYVGGAYCSFSFDFNAYAMVGLNTDPTTDASYISMDFAWYCPADSNLAIIYENGNSTGVNAGTHNADTVFSIVYDNEYVRYLKDGIEIRAVYVGAGKKYHFDSSIVQSPGFRNIRFGPYAAANAPLSFICTSSHSADGNMVFKRTNGANGWDGKATSREIQQGTAVVSARLDTTGTFIGLHEVNNPNASFPAFAFSIHRSGNGTWNIYEDGVHIGNVGSGYNNNTQWYITYDGVNVRYYADATLIRGPLATSANRAFQAGVACDSIGDRVSSIQFGAYTDRTWANVAGSGKPQDNATVGAIAGTNLVDSLGNSLGTDNVRNNMALTDWWKKGATIPWTQNGEYNVIISAVGDMGSYPLGPIAGQDDLWFCQETTGDSGSSGGWGGAPIAKLDPDKTYRFVVPIFNRNLDGGSYWGTDGVAELNTTNYYSNPYFAIHTLSAYDRWYLFVGYIYPRNSTGKSHDSAGVWDCKTGLKVAGGTNYCFLPDGTQPTHRAYQYYASNGAQKVFGRPLINCIDGTEPDLRGYFEEGALLNNKQRFDEIVPGNGKPENNATVGAIWGSNLSGRPTELTDGRITNGLDSVGDIRRALPANTGFRQSSTITRPLPRGARVVNLRDGENYTFPTAWGSGQIPSVQAYNNGYVDANNYLDIKALNLTSSGFIAEAKKVGPGTITPQSETTAGTPSAPRALEIVKGLSAEAHNDIYTYIFNIRVNNIPDGEPGLYQAGEMTVGLWTYDGATWQLNSTVQYYGEGGGLANTTINGASGSVGRDGMGANDRFGISIESGSGTILAFTAVQYGTTSGNTITSATPTNFPGIPFLILGGTEN